MRTPASGSQHLLVKGSSNSGIPTVIFDMASTVFQESYEFFWCGFARAIIREIWIFSVVEMMALGFVGSKHALEKLGVSGTSAGSGTRPAPTKALRTSWCASDLERTTDIIILNRQVSGRRVQRYTAPKVCKGFGVYCSSPKPDLEASCT